MPDVPKKPNPSRSGNTAARSQVPLRFEAEAQSAPPEGQRESSQTETAPTSPSQSKAKSTPLDQPDTRRPKAVQSVPTAVKQPQTRENRWQDLEEGLETLARLGGKRLS